MPNGQTDVPFNFDSESARLSPASLGMFLFNHADVISLYLDAADATADKKGNDALTKDQGYPQHGCCKLKMNYVDTELYSVKVASRNVDKKIFALFQTRCVIVITSGIGRLLLHLKKEILQNSQGCTN